MKFTDKSSGFEITLPDNWRKLFIFERVKNNPFQGLLPRTLTEGPILTSREGDAMVIAVQQPESGKQPHRTRKTQLRGPARFEQQGSGDAGQPEDSFFHRSGPMLI